MAEGQTSVPHLTYAPGKGISTGQAFASGKPIIGGLHDASHPELAQQTS